MKLTKKTIFILSLVFLFSLIFYIKIPNENPDKYLKNVLSTTIFSFSSLLIFFSIIHNQKIKKIFITLISIYIIILFSVRYTYGECTIGVLGAIHDTSISESIEFLKSLAIKFYIICIFLYLLIHASLSQISNLETKFNKYIFLLFGLSLLVTSVLVYYKDKAFNYFYSPLSQDEYHIYNYQYPIIYLFERNVFFAPIANYYLFYKINNNFKQEIVSKWTNVSRYNSAYSGKDVYIVNIGESAIKSHFSLYGYKIKTNFPISGLIQVDGAVSPSVQTRLSVPRILSKNQSVKDYDTNLNIIDLANSAGFETYWVSNQSQNGLYDTPISVIADRANHSYYSNIDYEHAKPDNVLIPKIEKIITTKTKKPKIIFINTMGSHPDFCDRISAQDHKFKTNRPEQLDCYDDSILYGFKFLDHIKKILEKNKTSYSIVYFSDHGLVDSKNPPYLVHGVTQSNFTRQAVEVPFFFISDNKNTKPIVIKQNYNLRMFYSTFASWVGIHADQIKPDESIFNYKPSGSELKVLDGTYHTRTITQ
ncbi:phosphoethanolamine transferase [Photobacterium damselae]|uniref:phosphoethanolamine transferase n=1 Tax=Photobacterium damselae TaxID=38293 RepID=UPI0025433A86